VTVAAGHVVPEDAPGEVGSAIASWLRGLLALTKGWPLPGHG